MFRPAPSDCVQKVYNFANDAWFKDERREHSKQRSLQDLQLWINTHLDIRASDKIQIMTTTITLFIIEICHVHN